MEARRFSFKHRRYEQPRHVLYTTNVQDKITDSNITVCTSDDPLEHLRDVKAMIKTILKR